MSLINNTPVDQYSIINGEGFFLNRFNAVEIVNNVNGENIDGPLKYDQRTGLLAFTQGDLRINVKQIASTSGQIPSALIKMSNSISASGEYDNEFTQIPIQAMSNKLSISGSQIPLGYVMQMGPSGILQWDYVSSSGSLVLDPAFTGKVLYNLSGELDYTLVSDPYILSGGVSLNKLNPSVSGTRHFVQSSSGLTNYSQITSQDLSTYLTQQNFSGNSINASFIQDSTIQLSKIVPRDTSKAYLSSQSGLVVQYSQIAFTDIQGQINASTQIASGSIDYQTKLTNYTPVVQSLNTLTLPSQPSSAVINSSGVASWQQEYNTLLSGLNTQAYVLNQNMQSGNISLDKLIVNPSTRQFVCSSSGSYASYQTIQYTDIQSVPSKITNFINATQVSGQYLQAFGTSDYVWKTLTIPSQTVAKSIWYNDATSTLQGLPGNTNDIVSYDASQVPYARSFSSVQSALRLAWSQISGYNYVISGLQSISTLPSGTSYFQITSSGNIQYTNSIPTSVLYSGMPFQSNVGLIGYNASNSGAQPPVYLSAGNPQYDQMYFINGSGVASSWVPLTGSGIGSVICFSQSGRLQRIDGDPSPLYGQYLKFVPDFGGVTGHCVWSTFSGGIGTSFMGGEGLIYSLQSKAILNRMPFDFYYQYPISQSGVFAGSCYKILQSTGINTVENIQGVAYNSDGFCATSASWSLFTANSIAMWSASGVTYTQRGLTIRPRAL